MSDVTAVDVDQQVTGSLLGIVLVQEVLMAGTAIKVLNVQMIQAFRIGTDRIFPVQVQLSGLTNWEPVLMPI